MAQLPLFPNSVVSNDIDYITQDDPSLFIGVTFQGRFSREMPGSQNGLGLRQTEVYVYRLNYADGTSVVVNADRGFATEADARAEVMFLGDPIGRLPTFMRDELNKVVLNIGDRGAFAEASARFFVVSTENMALRRSTNDMEETIFHESVHATLDRTYLNDPAWFAAQAADGVFVTEYAEAIPNKEDLAETALFAKTLFEHLDRLPGFVRLAMEEELPSRLAFFQSILPTSNDVTTFDDIISGSPGKDMIYALAGDDRVTMGDAHDKALGGDGDDTLVGGTGRDTLVGDDGADTLWGQAGNDRLFGGDSNDLLRGGADDDVLTGGHSEDTLAGDGGADRLIGGSDADTFLFQNLSASKSGAARRDVIVDFVSGEDEIDISNIDAARNFAGDQAFDFIGETAFSGAVGELRIKDIGDHLIVQMDTNGNGRANAEIFLRDIDVLVATDFIL